MLDKVKISIDVMGGDNSPYKTLEGLNLFAKRNQNINDYFFYLFGDETIINQKLSNFKYLENNYKIFDTKIVVSNELSAMSSIKKGKNSSMWKAIQSQIDLSADVTLSAGNTGVLLVMSKMILKTLENVDKPALAGLWPNENNMNIVLDLGANVECSEKNLIDFSEMGSALFKSLFPNEKAKFNAIIRDIEEINKTGRPILVGTVSIEKSEAIAAMLKRKGIKCQVLNAKQHELEATIVAQAGSPGAVTVATNMAGRGTDIILGGNPLGADIDREKWESDHKFVLDIGGLHIIGTERHDSRRIDNQLRGRAGRQGDPG